MGPGNDLMQKSGEELWQVLEAPPYNVTINASMKEVLRVMGYDNAQNMKQFGDRQFEEVEKFMQTTYHRVLKGKYKDKSSEELEEAMEKYYGVYSCIPNEYQVIGGFRLSIQSCVRALNGTSQVKGSKPQTNLRPPAADKEAIIKTDTRKLEKTINTWLRANFKIESETEQDVEDPSSLPPQPKCTVLVECEGNILTARVKCVACKIEIHLRKTNKSWNTNNYMRHIENKHLLPQVKGKQLSIKTIFQGKMPGTAAGGSDDNSNTNKVTTPRSEAGENTVELDSDESSNTTRILVHSEDTPELNRNINTMQRAPQRKKATARKKTPVLEDEILVDRYSPDPMKYVEVTADQGNSENEGDSSPVISRKNNSRKRTISETSEGNDNFLENVETTTTSM